MDYRKTKSWIKENLKQYVVDNPVLTPKQNNLEQITNQLSNR